MAKNNKKIFIISKNNFKLSKNFDHFKGSKNIKKTDKFINEYKPISNRYNSI